MRETPVKSAVAVSYLLGDTVYLFILILYSAHAYVESLALQKGRDLCF